MADIDVKQLTPLPSDFDMEGFKPVQDEIDFAVKWDWDAGAIIGTVVESKTVDMGKDGTINDVRLIVIEDADEERWTVWEAAQLKALFNEVKVGDGVIIIPGDMVNLGNGRRMRNFKASIKAA